MGKQRRGGRNKNHTERYGPSASSAVVVYVADHQHFSDFADERLIQPALNKSAPEGTPAVISVCAYAPSFFYNRIKEQAPASGRRCLASFEKRIAAELVDSEFDKEREVFLDVTKDAFPHFQTIKSGHDRSVRVCVFCQDDNMTRAKQLEATGVYGANYNYLKVFGKLIRPAHTYAFLYWLNDQVPCRVLPPRQWSKWGLTGGRDFAVLSGRHVVEYHDNWHAAVIVENVDGNWDPFARIASLTAHWEEKQKYTWKPDRFFELAYGAATPQRICEIVRNAADAENDIVDPDRATFREKVEKALPELKVSMTGLGGSDVVKIINTESKVARLLRGDLDITTDITEFLAAVELLTKRARERGASAKD